jgi:hypothetical protein
LVKRSKRSRVIGVLLVVLALGSFIAAHAFEGVSYDQWVRACQREGGTVKKTGSSYTPSGAPGAGGTTETKYVCLGPGGKVLSHHSTYR